MKEGVSVPLKIHELDLTISDMAGVWKEAGGLLAGLPGIEWVRILERGALVQFNSSDITSQQIQDALAQAGLPTTAGHERQRCRV